MWFEDILIVLIVSSLWLWLILVLSKGKLMSVNTKRTHRNSYKTTRERRSEVPSENKKKKV